MSSKKLPILIFSLFLAMLVALPSCEKKSLKTTKKQNNTAEIDTLIAAGCTHYGNVNFDSSYYYFNKATNLAIQEKDTSRILNSVSWTASSEMNKGDYSSCENTIIEAFPIVKKTKKYPYENWYIYNTLAINYMFLFDYRNALQYHTTALKLKVDQIHKIKSLNNIALVYIEKEEYRKAIQILLPLTLKKEFKYYEQKYIILDNLGECFYKLRNSKAIYYLKESLKLREIEKDEWGLITSYIRFAEFYLEDNPRLAYKYSRLAYEKATKIKDINDRLISLALLIKSSKGDQSKKYALDYIQINDSNNKAKQMAKNQFAKIKYDSKQEREENQILKIEKIQNEIQLEQHKNRVLLLFYLITIGLITTLVIFKNLKIKRQKEKVKTTIETENRISKKLHDEVANDLYQTIAFAETQDLGANENKELLLSNLANIYKATRNISKENSCLLQGADFENEIKELLTRFNSATINILVNGLEQVDWKLLDNIKRIIVYRIVQELLINMKKHSNCSLVMLIFKNNKNNLEINYSDNGAGAPIEKIILGNGLQNVRNRIIDVNGNITFESEPNKGFKSSIVLPL
jgi:signal transduction histidine kinase